ncbi:homeobox-leucine zipper protein athb-8 [Nicotiana attenuata]|uniref:Homeobox-leucine zipper protein athb-8 n=1 Tax=Nicotiana attenuata TaxID=49451 RepID=A0A314KQ42_NICAT|nr:homeobox-leucine zipper protein athb-8 [Nicotiana attenuata]
MTSDQKNKHVCSAKSEAEMKLRRHETYRLIFAGKKEALLLQRRTKRQESKKRYLSDNDGFHGTTEAAFEFQQQIVPLVGSSATVMMAVTSACKDSKMGMDNEKYVRYTLEQVEALERLYHECPKPSSLRHQQLIRESLTTTDNNSCESVVTSGQQNLSAHRPPRDASPAGFLSLAEETLTEFLSNATGTVMKWVQMPEMKVYWQGFSMDVHKIVQVDLKFPTKAIVSAVAKDFIDACKDSTLEKVLGHTWIVQNADPSGV